MWDEGEKAGKNRERKEKGKGKRNPELTSSLSKPLSLGVDVVPLPESHPPHLLLLSLRHCCIHNLTPSSFNSDILSILQHGRLHHTAVHSEHVCDRERGGREGE